uniref:Uncharacterized protein n=1 Tax=Helianthus annuus TaxID=4232 RepID=A0A251S0C0_HELAN
MSFIPLCSGYTKPNTRVVVSFWSHTLRLVYEYRIRRDLNHTYTILRYHTYRLIRG